MFAAQAGARRVYAVDRTAVTQIAEQIIKTNDLSECIQIIEGDMDNVHLPEQVNVIVSEWMGGFGVDENLLAPVLLARDRWLLPGGKMVPERVSALITPVWDENIGTSIEFWKEPRYGLDLSLIGEHTTNELHNAIHHVQASELLAEPAVMWTTDTQTDLAEDALHPFRAELSFQFERAGRLSALAAWFNAVLFDDVELSNAPDAPKTHWGRTILPLGKVTTVEAGTQINVKFVCSPISQNLCHNEWSVQIDEGSWEYYSGRQGRTASPGFH